MSEARIDSLEAESFWKQFGDVSLLGTVCTLKKDRRVGSELVDDLPAGATRRAGNSMVIRHGDGLNFDLRAQLGDRSENCSSLRTVRHSVRGILHVATRKYLPVCQQDRRSYMKVRVWSVR